MSKPALQWIPGFMHTARSGNMTRAAEQLNVTVSALSHQMRRLEERMGRRLMERGARGIELTADGQALYQKLEPHYQAIEELLSPHTQERGDSLTISSLGSLVNAWLLPRLGEFVRLHPEIQINLDSSVRMVDFDKELHIDAGLRFGLGSWPNVESHFLLDEWISPAASPTLLKQLGKPTLAELHKYPLIDAGSNISACRNQSAMSQNSTKPKARTVPPPRALASCWRVIRWPRRSLKPVACAISESRNCHRNMRIIWCIRNVRKTIAA